MLAFTAHTVSTLLTWQEMCNEMVSCRQVGYSDKVFQHQFQEMRENAWTLIGVHKTTKMVRALLDFYLCANG